MEIIYLSLHCHHQNDFCVKVGSNENHFNVSVGSDGQSHKTVSTNHNLSEEKGEPKRYHTEVLPLISLTPYRQAKPALYQPVSRKLFLYFILWSLKPISVRATVVLSRACGVKNNVRNNRAACCQHESGTRIYDPRICAVRTVYMKKNTQPDELFRRVCTVCTKKIHSQMSCFDVFTQFARRKYIVR